MKVSSATICALALAPSVTAASVRALKGGKKNKKDSYYGKKGGKSPSSSTAAQRAATCEFQAEIMHSYMTSTPFAEQVSDMLRCTYELVSNMKIYCG